ncbi:MAG TPA: Sec-independent protein translocase subunit TatA [Humibacillus xanthopallidus]|nr:Sec-independent protein translocase subunit TatA [Humibacillus xanthopallidus]
MADLGWPELSIIIIAFVLLFGWKKMPDMARSLGRSARIFKSEVDQMHTDESAGARAEATTTPTTYAAGPASLADAEARAAAAEAELASLRADAEVARLRAEREALDRTSGSH